MNKYQTAADVLKKEAGRTRSLLAAAEALDEVGSLENAAQEINATLTERRAELAKVERSIADASDRARGLVEDAEQIVAKRIADATVEADQIHEQAGVQARALIAKANESADTAYRRRDAAQSATREAEERLAEVREETAALEARLASARAERDRLLKA